MYKDNWLDAVVLLKSASPLARAQFRGEPLQIIPGMFAAPVSALTGRQIIDESFLRAFVGDTVEIQYSGMSPNMLFETAETKRIHFLQRSTSATFRGGADLQIGDVLVKAGSGYEVVEIACEVESWEDSLRNTSIPVGIQTSRGLHRGWVFVTDHTNSAAIKCVGSKIDDETDWTRVRFDEISLEGEIISIVKPQVLKIWKENKQ